MFRSRRSLSLVLFVALALGGCAAADGPSTFNATFPPEPSRDIDPIAVSFIDQTGLVTGMSPAAAGADGAPVTAEPADPNALHVEWPGLRCDGRISLVLADTGAGYAITVHVSPSIGSGFGCPTEPVLRAVTIHLRQPVDPTRVTVESTFP